MQSDNVQALFNYVASQMMDAGSEYEYETFSDALGGSASGGLAGIARGIVGFFSGGLTGSYSRTNGSASSHAWQNNGQNEASQASILYFFRSTHKGTDTSLCVLSFVLPTDQPRLAGVMSLTFIQEIKGYGRKPVVAPG